ncbi:MAG: hypothetical protein IKO87_05250, partial [Kiritimatiellae bacterium]|nr:hypothetical protein [Kiritimatiellia bacterium]
MIIGQSPVDYHPITDRLEGNHPSIGALPNSPYRNRHQPNFRFKHIAAWLGFNIAKSSLPPFLFATYLTFTLMKYVVLPAGGVIVAFTL